MAEYSNPPERTFTLFKLLPTEIQTKIFGHLDLRAKGRAAQVCKAWRDVMYHKSLWREVEARLRLRRPPHNLLLLASLTARGIRRVQVLGFHDSLSDLVYGMPDLHSLNLSSYRSAWINPALASVVGHHPLPHLTRLKLFDCPRLTDQSVAVLAKNCVNLSELDLTDCSNLTDKSLLHVGRHLAALTRLVVDHCAFTDVGIAYLTGSDPEEPTAGNIRLEHLDMSWCGKLTGEVLRLVAERLTVLRFLGISKLTNITETGFGHLARLVSLRELRANRINARDAWLAHLVDTDINILDLSQNYGLTGQGLAHLGRMGRLQQLDLSGFEDKTGLNFLVESNIDTLCLAFCDNLTDAEFDQVAKMTNLSKLDLMWCLGINDAGLLRLADGVTKLTSLDLSCNGQITDVGVHHLSRLPLRELDLSSCDKITKTGMGHLARMGDLRELDMMYCQVSDAGLAILAEGAAKLATLNLAGCHHITDDGLPYLAKMANLRYVNLSICHRITSAGITDLVRRAPRIATVKFLLRVE